MPVDVRGTPLESAPTPRLAPPCLYTVVDRGVAFGATVALPPLARPARPMSVLGVVRAFVPAVRLRYIDVGVPRLASLGTARDAAGLARPALLRVDPEASLGVAREAVALARPALLWLRYVDPVVAPEELERGGASAVYARPS